MHSAGGFYRIEEREILQVVVDQALACKSCLSDTVKSSFSYLDKDQSVIISKLTIALKVIVFSSFAGQTTIKEYCGNKLDDCLSQGSFCCTGHRHRWSL